MAFYGTNDNLSSMMLMQQMFGPPDYTSTPEYLNQQRLNQRTKDMTAYNTSKSSAYQSARDNLLNQFKDLGDPNGATPYLQALEADYNKLGYHPGTDYSYDGPVQASGWDEQAYLAANPDVAAALRAPGAQGDSNYYQTGLDHYLAVGKNEGRGGVNPGFMNPAVQPHVVGGTADSWDDPNSLLNKDYGASQYITNVRQGRKDASYGNANTSLQQLISGLGYDQPTLDTLTSGATKKLSELYNTSGVSANSYDNVFDPQAVLDSVMGTERSKNRTILTGKTNAAFGGLDPNADFADTADDSYINDIVGKQYGDAFGAIDRAYKRGALTDTGYNSGLSYLGDQRKVADSTAQTLGGAVLTRDRGTLSGIKSNAMDAASSWDFGKPLDPSSYLSDYGSKKTALTEGLGGDIASALSGQNWFDVGDVLNKAGYAQGAQNTAPLAGGFTTPAGLATAAARDKDKTAARGLGGTGLF